MFDRQSGEMGIRDEVRLRAGRFQERAEHIAMPLCRLWYPGYLAGKSCFDLFPCVHHRRSHLEDAWIGDDAEKREQTMPRQTDPRGAVEL